jgi:hypothetical protein
MESNHTGQPPNKGINRSAKSRSSQRTFGPSESTSKKCTMCEIWPCSIWRSTPSCGAAIE